MASSIAASPDVVVVGAGPAGSATALGLARAGHAVLLLDRATFPRSKPCAEFLGPAAVARLAALGVLPALRAAGAAVAPGLDLVSDGVRLRGEFAEPGAGISRAVLDATLVAAARAAGVGVLEGATVTELLYDGGAVAGVLTRVDGRHEAIRARLVVGADGLRSRVARLLGGTRRGPLDRVALVAHMRLPVPLPRTEMHVRHRAYVGLNPVEHDLVNVAAVLPARAVARGLRPAELLARALDRVGTAGARCAGAAPVGDVRAVGPFAQRAGRVVADGAALVGDAAEFFDPFTGDGIQAALAGAELLATAAHAALAEPGLVTARQLAPYVAARRRLFQGKWTIERVLGYGMQWPWLFQRSLARLARVPESGSALIAVTGASAPARSLLAPGFLWRVATA